VLPLVTPVLIAAIRATATLVEGGDGVGGWLGVLVAFDAMFLAAGYLVFGHLLED
jgi:heme exporter protein B